MKDSTRARVAAVVGSAAQGKKLGSVYDYSGGAYRNASAEVRSGRVNGYDYSTGTHFSGSGSSLDFYDYETGRHVQLALKSGGAFSGYDYGSGRHFSGSINGRSISLYDYETGRYYNFSV